MSGSLVCASMGESLFEACEEAPGGSVVGIADAASMMLEPSVTYLGCPVVLGCTGPAATDEVYYVGILDGGLCMIHWESFCASGESGYFAMSVAMVMVVEFAVR